MILCAFLLFASSEVGLSIGVFGAPASGKSEATHKIKEKIVRIANSPQTNIPENIRRSLANLSRNHRILTIDILRDTFKALPPEIQLYEIIRAYEGLYFMHKKYPIFTGFFRNIENIVKELSKRLRRQAGLKIEPHMGRILFYINGDLINPLDQEAEIEIEAIDQREIEYQSAKVAFLEEAGKNKSLQENVLNPTINELSEYKFYQGVTRFYQVQSVLRIAHAGIEHITFDEGGGSAREIIELYKPLKKYGYINIALIILPKSIICNFLLNAIRMIKGSDGGRDSSTNIGWHYFNLKAEVEKIKRRNEEVPETKSPSYLNSTQDNEFIVVDSSEEEFDGSNGPFDMALKEKLEAMDWENNNPDKIFDLTICLNYLDLDSILRKIQPGGSKELSHGDLQLALCLTKFFIERYKFQLLKDTTSYYDDERNYALSLTAERLIILKPGFENEIKEFDRILESQNLNNDKVMEILLGYAENESFGKLKVDNMSNKSWIGILFDKAFNP